jgi:hypothetical protein
MHMSRNIIIIAIIGLLAACTTQGDGETADSSIDVGSSTVATASADASADSSAGGATGTASAACSEAFAAVAEQDVSSLSAMGDLPEVEATIEQCESIADWMAGASEVVGEDVNPSTAELLLDIRCQLPALGGTAVCEELGAS